MNDIIPTNKVADLRSFAVQAIEQVCGFREAENIVFEIFEHYLGWKRTDVVLNANERISESEMLKVYKAAKRVASGEPWQYVRGTAYFSELNLKVNPHVLIPRPETEELVAWICYSHSSDALNILDVGTGSGAIALALKNRNRDWNVHALDVSEHALAVAKENANDNFLNVHFHLLNMLENPLPEVTWSVIVSNPPYIPESERSTMSAHVVGHEPSLALFVPDSDDLIFYRRIIEEGKRVNCRTIYFEIHEERAEGVMDLFEANGYEPELKLDLQKKPRMVRGFLKE